MADELPQFRALGHDVRGLLPALEVFPAPARVTTVSLLSDEVTAVCPVTGQPDFYTVAISYTPGPSCIESKSLKLYLQAYRTQGIFYEAVVNVILDDLVAATKPRRLTVEGDFRVRGGISSVVTATYEAPTRGRGRKR